MTDRLSALLHEEADRLHVPMPTARETIAAGRRIRRRRRLTQAGVAAAVVAVLGVGAAFVGGDAPDRSNPDPIATDPQGGPVDLGVVFAVDDTVYLDGGAADGEDAEVAQTLYYTSAGLLVRTNKTGDSDGGAPFHFQLVGADGKAQPLDLTLGEVVPSTDPTQPYLAYSEADGDGVRVIVRRRDDRGAGGPGGRDGLDRLGRLDRTAGRARRRYRLRLRLQPRPRRRLAHGGGRAGRALSPGPPTVVRGRTIAISDRAAEVVEVDSGERAVRERRVAPSLARRPLRGRWRGREGGTGAGPRGRRLRRCGE